MSTYNTEKLDCLEPDYLANYGLSQAPFSNLHDDSFLYLDSERAQRLNLLQHMIQYNNLLLMVQGEHGVGKTSLLTRFVKNKADNWYVCEITANALMDAGQLLFQAAQGFGLQQVPRDSSELQHMLYARVATLHHSDQIPILLIDDAHELPKDALLAIFNLADAQIFNLADAQVDGAHLLRIILFAEPIIEKILSANDVRPLRERITHNMAIPPLDEDTTAEYLKHRMAVAGFNGGSPFTPKMVKRIYKASGGIPERINALAHETLDKGDFGREEAADIVVPAHIGWRRKSGALIAIAIVVVSLLLVFLNRINRFFEDKASDTKTITLPVKQPMSAMSNNAQHPALQDGTATTTPTTPAPVNDTTPSAVTQHTPVQEKIIALNPEQVTPAAQAPSARPNNELANNPNSPSSSTTTATTVITPTSTAAPTTPAPEPILPPAELKVQSVVPDPVPTNNAPQTITINGEGFTAQSAVFVSSSNKDHQIPAERIKFVNDKQLQVTLTVGSEPDQWQLHVIDPQHGNSNTLAFGIATAQVLREKISEWVLTQEPGRFTLQLFGSHEQKNAEDFIRTHKLVGTGHYFKTELQGGDWYSVVYGVYPDQAAAAAAIKTLPASLSKITPWVRRFDDIQASINASRKVVKPQAKPAQKSPVPLTAAMPKHADEKQSESWIWSQDPRSFTLQLMGARENASISKFMRQYPSLDGSALYFHTRQDGRDWYAIIYGVYPTRQKAQEAIKRLPPALQKASPWIRSFASIQGELSSTE